MKKNLFILIAFCGALSASAQPTAGLVAHWDMNGTTNDVSGNAHNGHGNNITPAIGQDGIMGHAWYFNGVNSSITIPYSPSFNLTKFSICARVRVMGFYNGPCDANMIFGRGKTGTGTGTYSLYFTETNGAACTGFDSTVDNFLSGAGDFPIPGGLTAFNYSSHIIENKWYTVVVTFNDTVYNIYVNDTLKTSVNTTSPGAVMGVTTDSINIGLNTFEPTFPYPFKGIIDDISFYNRVLNNNEITQLNNSTGIMTLDALSFWDTDGTCIFDKTRDPYVTIPVGFEIDSNGIAIDTINATSGFYYSPNGNVGDIYAFKAISVPPGITLTCPPSGIVYDTISTVVNNYPVRKLGFICSGSTDFDLSLNADFIAGRHLAKSCIIVNNPYCDSVAATLTMNFSPKYVFGYAVPAPSVVSGNTITWNFPALSSFTQSVVDIHFNVPGAWLTAGDTINSIYSVTPTTGDINPGNNNIIITDTVRGSYDPNEMSVNPSGYISAGTQLQYTINFENTGNDTAFNIIVLDTLSDNLDVKSLKIVAASAVMNIGVPNVGSWEHNVVKFYFPNINLLDSSHHGKCDGMVIFTVNTKHGLANGTTIFNRAGIYFDYNSVVNTNTVENIIGLPSKVSVLSNYGNIKIFPNPANNILNITATDKITTIAINNLLGQTLYSHEYNTENVQVDISGLPIGIYFIKINGTEVRKFVKL